MRILIITVQYYPAVNPNVYRWGAIAEYWKQQGHEVSILCSKRSGSPVEEIRNGISVYRAGHSTLLDWGYNLLGIKNRRGNINNQPDTQKNSSLRKILEKLMDWTWRKFYWPDGSCLWSRPGRKTALQLINKHKFDVVISVGLPFTAHLIGKACKMAHPALKWHMDIEDPFCYSKEFFVNNHRLYNNLNIKAERKAFQLADSISVTVDKALQAYLKHFPFAKSKIRVIPPLFNLKPESEHSGDFSFNSNNIHLCYIGTFYSNVRSPFRLLSIIKAMKALSASKIQKLTFHFFGEINPEALAVFNKFPELTAHFVFHGLVDRKIINSVIQQTDFLINIGNTTHYHLPSKSVDYLMSGKPIINICQTQEDTFKELFQDYQLIFNIDPNLPEDKAAMEIINFVEMNKGKMVSKELTNELGKPFQLKKIADAYLQSITDKFIQK